MSRKTHGVGLGREKQARKPSPEADRQVAGRKLGVRSRMRAEKPTAWAQEEKSKRENPSQKLIGR